MSSHPLPRPYYYILVLAVIVVGIAGSTYTYHAGKTAGIKEASLDSVRLAREAEYSKALATVRKERDAVTNEFVAVCNEYRLLKDSYDLLYKKTGTQSGLPHYSRIGEAKSIEDDCYY